MERLPEPGGRGCEAWTFWEGRVDWALSLPCSVPTFTVIPEGPRSPSPLMEVDNEEEPMAGVPLEQYRAWLGEDLEEVGKLGFSYLVTVAEFVWFLLTVLHSVCVWGGDWNSSALMLKNHGVLVKPISPVR